MKAPGASALRRLLAMGLALWLAGCNLTTERPLFTAADAADVRLEDGYYSTSGDVAFIRVFAGRTVVSAQADQLLPYDAIAVDLGQGVYLLQYGKLDEQARSYVLFRYEPDGSGIQTAVYDCRKSVNFFENFGMSITGTADGHCAMGEATRDRVLRAHRALARQISPDSWSNAYRRLPYEEGRQKYRDEAQRAARSR